MMPPDEPERNYAAATKQMLAESEDTPEDTEPPPKPPPPPPRVTSPEEKAVQLRDVVPAAYVYAATASLFPATVDVAGCQAYLRQLLREAGDPADPIARMMVEQLAMAHHAIGRLHVRAATRDGLTEVVAYHGMLARLMSEFRKTTLALQSLLKRAGEQTGRSEQPVPEGQPPTAGTIKAGEPVIPPVSACSELTSNDEVEGHDRQAICA